MTRSFAAMLLSTIAILSGCTSGPQEARTGPETSRNGLTHGRAVQILQDACASVDRLYATPADGSSGCELQPEKLYLGKQTESGILCRTQARLDYIIAFLACDLATDREACCEQAYQDYCAAFDACRP